MTVLMRGIIHENCVQIHQLLSSRDEIFATLEVVVDEKGPRVLSVFSHVLDARRNFPAATLHATEVARSERSNGLEEDVE